MTAIKSIIEKYLLLWVIALSGFAFGLAGMYEQNVFTQSKPLMPYMIVLTMLAIGWMLPIEEIQQVVRRWPTVLGGSAVQYLCMPAFAFLLTRIFTFESSIVIGIMMVGCVPGAMASNVLTLMARGNTSYSVSLTTVATLLSPVVVPLALYVTLGERVPEDKIWAAAGQLSWMVVGPVVVGHFLSRLLPSWQPTALVIGPIVANLTILWIVASVVAWNHGALQTLDWRILMSLITLNLLGFVAGFAGGSIMKLPESMRRALTLEVGMQNAGLGTALVGSLFPEDNAVAIPTALYTFGCMLTGTILAYTWGRTNKVRESNSESGRGLTTEG